MLKNLSKTPHPEAYVFSGGSSRGYAYIGTCKYLEEKELNQKYKVLVGCSIGAIFALMFMIGYTSAQMETLMADLDLEILRDITANSILNFFNTGGIDTGMRLVAFVESLMEIKTGKSTWTFQELHDKYHIHLILIGSEVFVGYTEMRIFDYLKTPELTISEAMRISASYPPYFIPIDSRYGKLTDGGISNCYPIDLYTYFNIPLDKTIGFYLRSSQEHRKPEGTEFLLNVLSSIISKDDRKKCLEYKDNTIILELNHTPIDPFSCSNNLKKKMILEGYQQTRDQMVMKYPWLLDYKITKEGFSSVENSPKSLEKLKTTFHQTFLFKIESHK